MLKNIELNEESIELIKKFIGHTSKSDIERMCEVLELDIDYEKLDDALYELWETMCEANWRLE